MKRSTLALVALLLAGCNAPPPIDEAESAALDVEPTPPAPPIPSSPELHLVALDGRLAFPPAEALAYVAEAAPGADAGGTWWAEASLARDGPGPRIAGNVLAVDEAAARVLDLSVSPAPGSAVLASRVAHALGAALGDTLTFTTTTWPAPRAMQGFEMELVGPCGESAGRPWGPCFASEPTSDTTRLAVGVPPDSEDFLFHPDVHELRDARYLPAYWNGTITSPSGVVTPFQTSAGSLYQLSEPAGLKGPVGPGDWTIAFTLDLNGTRWSGPAIGFITYDTRGLSHGDPALHGIQDARTMTDTKLATSTTRTLTLRVASIVESFGDADGLRPIAILHPDDARALMGVREGEVTGLVLRADTALPDRLSEALRGAPPILAPLHAWSVPAAGEEPHAPDLVLAAPAALDVGTLPPVPGVKSAVLALEAALPPGTTARLGAREIPPGADPAEKGASLPEDTRWLTAPSARGELPWTLLPGAKWPDIGEMLDAFVQFEHVVLVSDDLARELGLDPTDLTYQEILVETLHGSRTLYVMGSVAGGPPHAVWMSAALAASFGQPLGARLVVSPEPGADAAALARDVAAAWAEQGVATS